MSDHEKIYQYKDRAEELRTVAEDFLDDEARAMLLRLASDYEQMADSLSRCLSGKIS